VAARRVPLLLIGFGTKMGLAPMHTWKPDTYGEAPSLVSGLMAGALTSCAFLGVARVTEVVAAAGLGSFARPVLLAFGLLSLAVAATFVIGQRDVKRLLAYSSVEHMGLLVLGLGLGGVGAYGSMLHLVNNGLAKGWMFLVTGNIVLATGSATALGNRGLVRTLPASATLLVLGLFAVTGSPPFGLFLSEFTILRAAVDGGHAWIAVIILVTLAVIFVGMAALVLRIVLGNAPLLRHAPGPRTRPARKPWLIVGPVAGRHRPDAGRLPPQSAAGRSDARSAPRRKSTMSPLRQAGLRNRRAILWGAVPVEPVERFLESVTEAVASGWRVASFFGMPDGRGQSRLVAILADDAEGSSVT
jgi:hydrogenase-4 component F